MQTLCKKFACANSVQNRTHPEIRANLCKNRGGPCGKERETPDGAAILAMTRMCANVRLGVGAGQRESVGEQGISFFATSQDSKGVGLLWGAGVVFTDTPMHGSRVLNEKKGSLRPLRGFDGFVVIDDKEPDMLPDPNHQAYGTLVAR